jgi:hypothetical protein
MMIAHASLPADDPERAARILAEIMQGEAMPFPPGPGCWMAWAGDDSIELEISPRGAFMRFGEDGGTWERDERKRGGCDAHVAICVNRPWAEILEIARKAGWPAARFKRGEHFHLNEVWVEGHFLVEFLDPGDTADYKRNMNRANWKKTFGQAVTA